MKEWQALHAFTEMIYTLWELILATYTAFCSAHFREGVENIPINVQGRFLEEFGVQEEDEGGEDTGQGSSKRAEQPGAGAGKPPEHAALFGGNCDDHFRLGIKLTRWAVAFKFSQVLKLLRRPALLYQSLCHTLI